jgi:hypothetical protein
VTAALDLEDASRPKTRTRTTTVVTVGVFVALVILAVATARTGVGNDPRLVNPGVIARAERPLWGVANWPLVFSWIFVFVAGALLIAFARLSWRQRHLHHGLIIFLAVTGLAWLDPPANWVTFTVFDPRFLHFPTTLPWFRLAPLVEPVTNVPGYPMYYFSIALIGFTLWRRVLLPRAHEGSFMQRHPLWTIFAVGFVVGVVWDIPTELFMLRTRMYLYSQAAGPRWHWGHASYPVVWGFFTWFSIAVITVLFHRDDRGRSLVLSRWSERLFPQRRGKEGGSSARQVVAGVALLSAAYCVPLAFYGTLRIAHLTHPGSSGWTYSETKVYDPQGVLQKAGQKGPYYR